LAGSILLGAFLYAGVACCAKLMLSNHTRRERPIRPYHPDN
jgi:hypothetical protein